MQRPPALKKVGILIFPGVQVIDFTGPYEVLCHGSSRRGRLFDVVTIGLTPDMIRSGTGEPGLKLLPEFTIDDAPKLDILIIPGGEIDAVSDNANAMAWIDRVVAEAECVMSVCNGAFILAEGGHLRNQKVTTFYWFLDELKEAEPTCMLVHDARFADNGKIVTTAGLSSGIDGALHLIERYGSRFDAEQAALGLEYDWQPERNWARAGLADRHLVTMLGAGFPFRHGGVSQWTVVQNNGTRDAWTKAWTFQSALERSELLSVFESKMAETWTKSPSSSSADESAWTFKDDQGQAWSARLELSSTSANHWSAHIRVERAKE
jgi:putative intracellular protease/amidase